MRSHAKAPSAGSTQGRTSGRAPKLALAAIALGLLTLVLGVALAAATAPVLTIEDASEVSYVTAKAKGTVNPEGKETSYHFEYATQAQFEASEWAEASTAGFGNLEGPEVDNSAHAAQKELTGLSPSTVYHLRLVASNEDGPSKAIATNTFETKAVAKPIVTIEAASSITDSSAHFAGHVNPNAPGAAPQDPAFDASWRFTCVPDCGSLGGPAVAADNTSHEVKVDATGLEPNREYTITLHASNAGGEETAVAAPFETEVAAPDITLSYPADATASTQTLRAYVNPHNSALSDCHFEYGLSESYDQSAPCSPAPGVSNEDTLVTASLSGLQADTAYHYRLVAESNGGPAQSPDAVFETFSLPQVESCPNPLFHQGASANLPDCRAYEMVSPPDKNGGNVIGAAVRTRAAANGSALAFASLTGFSDVKGESLSIDYLAQRTEQPGTNGWSTHSITPGGLQAIGFVEQIFNVGFDQFFEGEMSDDLNHGVFISAHPLTDDPATSQVVNLYEFQHLRTPVDEVPRLVTPCPACEQLGPLPPTPPHMTPQSMGFVSASADFNHVIVDDQLALTLDAQGLPSDQHKLYDATHAGDGTELSLVTRVPDAGSECDGPSAPACTPTTATRRMLEQFQQNAVSRDGSHIYFEAFEPGSDVRAVYLRRNSGTPDAFTVKLNVNEQNPVLSTSDAAYKAATPDGRYGYFTTKDNLLPSDQSNENLTDLYRWDADASAGSRLTLISAREASLPANVQGVIGVSDDGSYAYFVATGQLVTGQPVDGGAKIFVWHNGSVKEVARVDGFDQVSLVGDSLAIYNPKTSRVTPDGTHLLFVSKAPPEKLSDALPHDSTGDNCIEPNGCLEVYFYDATSAGSLACISCSRPDAPAQGNSDIRSRLNQGIVGTTTHLSHPLSENGRYAFFNSAERLVPSDTNGTSDVYEYDSLTGQRHLISSGESKLPSAFLDASLDGKNVFFVTVERLSGWDIDRGRDVYDARIDGGLPEPPQHPAICTGDACQPPPLAINDSTPASRTFAGPGNPKPHQRHRRRHRRGRDKRHRDHHNTKPTSSKGRRNGE